MSSGLEGSDMNPDSPGNEEKMYVTSDWVEFALNLPMDKSKENEKDWEYFTAGVVVLGDILNSVVPNGLESYAHRKLFEPLGIKNYKWQYTPTGVPNTAGGFQMSSLDNAKYGQLYLNNGTFQNTRILTKDWTEKSLYKHVQIPDVSDQHYGYLFWNQTFVTNHKTYESFLASGNGGNKIVIFKDLNSVVVITAQAYNQPYMHQQAHEMITEYILPALVD
jgi:CubicO group peptidase (beta-lactamase class C family)